MASTDPLAPAFDPGANRGAVRLAVPPAVFLLHFSAVYGVNALACRFHWPPTLAGLPLVPAVVAALTLLAIALVLLVAHRGQRHSTEGETASEYDLAARRAFVAKAASMVAWLAAAGMLVVALPVLVARPCS
jgi:hypothetical protein